MTSNTASLIFYVMLSFIIIIIINDIFINIMLKKDNKNKLKISMYGIFVGLTNQQIIAMSAILLLYFYFTWILISSYELTYISLYVIMVLTVVYIIFTKKYKFSILEIFNSGAIFATIYLSKLLSGFLAEVRYVWYVNYGNIALKIFLLLYCLYFLIKSLNDIVVNNQYVKESRK